MKTLSLVVLFNLLAIICFAQRYQLYQKTSDVSFSYKWGKAKIDGKTMPALLLKIHNQNNQPINYSLSVDLYYEGILKESGELNNCILENKTRTGKLNGVYLVPEKFTFEQIGQPDFKMELNDIEVSKVEQCAQE